MIYYQSMDEGTKYKISDPEKIVNLHGVVHTSKSPVNIFKIP